MLIERTNVGGEMDELCSTCEEIKEVYQHSVFFTDLTDKLFGRPRRKWVNTTETEYKTWRGGFGSECFWLRMVCTSCFV
jgi:hypothetical protein